MNEIKINKREFDLAKKRLKEFSEKTCLLYTSRCV